MKYFSFTVVSLTWSGIEPKSTNSETDVLLLNQATEAFAVKALFGIYYATEMRKS